MEGHWLSPPPLAAADERRREQSLAASMKKGCLSFAASLQEGFRYLKATLVGQVTQANKLTARYEREATEADLQTAKQQVEAADAVEEKEIKKSLDKSI